MEKKNVIFPPPLFNSWVLCLITPLEPWPVLLSAGVYCVCVGVLLPRPRRLLFFPSSTLCRPKLPRVPEGTDNTSHILSQGDGVGIKLSEFQIGFPLNLISISWCSIFLLCTGGKQLDYAVSFTTLQVCIKMALIKILSIYLKLLVAL